METTPPMEDYIRAIHELEAREGKASTSRLAEELDVAQASVTSMVKRLSKGGFVRHEAYKGVTLTRAGERVAIEVIRHHRLLELYLSQELGLSWDQVHEEADRLEHHISEDLEAAIAEALGDPTVDPHGDPIPNVDLEWPDAAEGEPLTDVANGARARVVRVLDQAPDTLRALSEAGVVPGATLEVLEQSPATGVSHLRVGGRDIHLAMTVTSAILVQTVNSDTDPPAEVEA